MSSVKKLKYLPLLSLVFALVLSLVGVAAFGAPVDPHAEPGVSGSAAAAAGSFDGTVVRSVALTDDSSELIDIDGVYSVLLANRLFGSDIYDDEALVDQAQIYLLDKAETVDGVTVIRRDTVNGFIASLYGRTVANSSDGEYYTVPARGYDPIGHEICDLSLDGDSVVVTSVMRVGAADPVKCVTVLSKRQNEFGYMLISADIVE